MLKTLQTDDDTAIQNLPPKNRARRLKRSDAKSSLHAQLEGLFEQIQNSVADKQDIDRQENSYRNRMPGERVDKQRMAQFEARRKVFEDEKNRLIGLQAIARQSWQVECDLDTSIKNLLNSISHRAVNEVIASIPRGATVETIRSGIISIDEKAEKVRLAPREKKLLVAQIETEVDAIAKVGQPTVDPRIQHGDPSKLANEVRAESGKFFTWLMADEIKKKLADMLPEDGPNTLTDDQREKQLAALAKRRLELERIEEALIEKAEAEGRYIARRPDASPEAILGVEIVGRR